VTDSGRRARPIWTAPVWQLGWLPDGPPGRSSVVVGGGYFGHEPDLEPVVGGPHPGAGPPGGRAGQWSAAHPAGGREAGIGKTRLLAEFAARARQAGGRVLTGACLPVGEGALAYGPISQALRQLVRELEAATLERLVGAGQAELARLVPDLGPG
jgi:hypothetical protein